MPRKKTGFLIVALVSMAAGAGCNGNSEFLTEDRLNNGMVIILPGIEGYSGLNEDIRRGLLSAGMNYAMPIHSWGRPIPGAGMLLNQVDFIGNRLAGVRVANMVTEYQDSHPGRPVYIVGHSGGGGVAVFAAEAMPKDRQVDGLILLSASISSAYNLTKALEHCGQGIVNFYNRSDTTLLGVGTSVIGNVDGTHGPSAGLIGFDWPKPGDKQEKKQVYGKLYQVEVTPAMSSGDPHASTTRPGFVAMYVSPWIYDVWPATNARMYTAAAAEDDKALADSRQ